MRSAVDCLPWAVCGRLSAVFGFSLCSLRFFRLLSFFRGIPLMRGIRARGGQACYVFSLSSWTLPSLWFIFCIFICGYLRFIGSCESWL